MGLAERRGVERFKNDEYPGLGGFYSTSGISFADGVLTFDHQPHTNIDYGEEREKGLQRTLEAGL